MGLKGKDYFLMHVPKHHQQNDVSHSVLFVMQIRI